MREFWSILALSIAVAGPAVASIPEIPDPEASGLDPRTIVAFRRCALVEVLEESRVLLYDHASGESHEVTLDERVKLRAKAKRDFGGRRKLDFKDLAAGQELQVNIRRSDGAILGIDVLPVDP